MDRKVAVIGVGVTPPRTLSPDLSYKEMIYAAASSAYSDAGVAPGEIGGFVTCAEDFLEGTSIFDEYTPDPLGAVRRPVHTITGDGLHGLAAAVLQIRTGLMDRVAVEAHSKASNILTLPHILDYALDPVMNRPLRTHPNAWAGMEMRAYLASNGTTEEDCARVVEKNKGAALVTGAPYGAEIGWEAALSSPPLFDPLKEVEIAPHSDGAIVLVLAAEGAIPKGAKPVWVKGIGWISDSPTLETRSWGEATYARLSARMAYRMAGIEDPAASIDLAEVDDTFAFKELQHCDALGLFGEGGAAAALRSGSTVRDGETPINPSGGSLGWGSMLEANGLYRAAEVVLQIRREAGRRQVRGASVGVAQSWRGVPTSSGAVVVLSAG